MTRKNFTEPKESSPTEPKSFQPDEQIAEAEDGGGSQQPEEKGSHALNFQKLENQLNFEQAIQQNQEIILQERKNGKTKGILPSFWAKETKSPQESGDQTVEGIRSLRGANRSHPTNPSDCQGQGTGLHHPPPYEKEWVEGSAVHPDLVRLNVRYLEGQEALNSLLYSDNLPRTNTGRLTTGTLKKYQHIEHGGWWCGSGNSLWGCFKPDKPRPNPTKGKPIKYEHPQKEPTGVFTLRISERISAKIFERLGLDPLDDATPENVEDREYWDVVRADEGIPIIITEGAKKAGSLLSAGFTAIAVSGIWNGRRKDGNGKKVLIPELEEFAVPGRTIYFAFDQDEKRSTRRNNRKALFETGILLKAKGCKVNVIEWEPTVKGVDDLIVSRGEQHFFERYQKALDFDDWSADRLRELTYKPALKLDSSTKYIGDFAIPPSAKLICIKSPKNSGKTERLVKICEEAQFRGQKVLVLTHRTQLGVALAKRFGIDYVSETSTSETKGLLGYALCFDSLKKKSQARFDPEEWHGCIVILDECEQSIWHLLNARTEVSKYRIEILRNFQQVIINALGAEDGIIILSDADLSDISIDYIKSLSESPTLEPWVVLKEGNPTPWDVTVWEKPEDLMARLEVELTNGGKVWISVDGQKPQSKWGARNFEAYLTKKFFDKRNKILRIDRETVEMPGHPAFECMDKLDDIIANYDIVIASPTVETGVSIDIRKHFTGVYDFAQGVIPVASVLQRMARVRDTVPRHIWAKNSSHIGRIGNGSASLRRLKESQDTLYKANVLALSQSDLPDDLDFEEARNFQPQSLWTWLKMAARINLGMMRYRHEIILGLIRDGHSVKMGNPEDLDNMGAPPQQLVKEELAGTRDRIYWEHNNKIATTPNPDDQDFEELKTKRKRTEAELITYRKGQLSRTYSPELASKVELIEADDKRGYSKWRLAYYLTCGAEFLADRDRNIVNSHFSLDGTAFFLPDFNSKLLGGKILLLNYLEIPKLLEPETEWSNSSPFLMELKEKALKYTKDLKDAGVTVQDKDTPVAIAQKILRLLDKPLQCSKRIGARGQRERIYLSPEFPLLTQEIFSVWLERDKAALAEKLAAEKSGVHVGNMNNISPTVDTDMDVDTTPKEKSGVHVGNINNISPTVDTDMDVDTTPKEKSDEGTAPENLEVSEENPEPAEKTGVHVGNINNTSPTVDTNMDVDTTPKEKSHIHSWVGNIPIIIPRRVKQVAVVATVGVAATTIALPAAAAPQSCGTPMEIREPAEIPQPEKSRPSVREHHWEELPKPGRILHWVTGGEEKLVLKQIDPDGRCQVWSLLSGIYTQTRITQLRPSL